MLLRTGRSLSSGVTRAMSAAVMSGMTAARLVYERHGEPADVLQLVDECLPPPADEEVLVQILAAPINPSDINTVEGKYPTKLPLPAVGGNEGVGVVCEVGGQVQGLAAGDWVIPATGGLGWWRSAANFPAASLRSIPSDLPLDLAATLTVNPPSALLMLRDFVELSAGDVVVQNGASSAVGQLVVQLAKQRGLRTVNIIRDRPGWEEAEARLKQLGADVIATEATVKTKMRDAGLPPGALGLNCVGGSACAAVAKSLRDGATLVTYGGMSLQPVSVPTGLLIFKELTCKGFWLSSKRIAAQKPAALDELIPLAQQGRLSIESEQVGLRGFKSAMRQYREGTHGRKLLLIPER